MQTQHMDQNIIETGPRRVVASYSTYDEAQAAVDYLSDEEFPVDRTAIVAEGLRLVEQVTGRRTYLSTIVGDAFTGALVGGFIGFFFGLFDLVDPLVSAFSLAFWGIVFGAVVGAIFGLVAEAVWGGERDFTSISGIEAERYLVMVDDEFANEAARLLKEAPAERGAVQQARER